MSPLAQAAQDIDIALDIAHSNAATLFLEAARSNLAPFRLHNHSLLFKTNPGAGLLIKSRGDTRCWWELGRAPHKPGSVFQAIAEIGSTLDDDLPEAVANKLNGVTL